MQVSDRRMTFVDPRSGAVARHDDESNKAVLYDGSTAIAYTGLGNLAGQATDWWILETIAPARSLDDVFELLEKGATDAFAALPKGLPAWARRHTFVLAGWGRFGLGEGSVSPFAAKISNYDNFLEQSSTVRDRFSTRIMIPEGEEALFVPAGEHMLDPERDWCRQELAYHLEHKRGAADLVEILAGGIRTVAKRCDSVGRGLLVNSIPLAGVTRDDGGGYFAVQAHAITEDRVSFFQLHHLEDGAQQAVWEGPHLVGDGIIHSGLKMALTEQELEASTADDVTAGRGFRNL
jgi:hypothetical protein